MKYVITFIMLISFTAISAQTDTISLQTIQLNHPVSPLPAEWFPDFERGDYARNWNDIMTQRRGNPVKVIGIYMASIALNAVGDGLNDSGNKQWGHVCNALSIGTLLVSPFIIDYGQGKWYQYALSYAFLRVASFDIIYNATRGNSLTYVGGDNLWDSAMRQFSPSGLMFFRGLSFTVGLSIPIGELGRSKKRLSN